MHLSAADDQSSAATNTIRRRCRFAHGGRKKSTARSWGSRSIFALEVAFWRRAREPQQGTRLPRSKAGLFRSISTGPAVPETFFRTMACCAFFHSYGIICPQPQLDCLALMTSLLHRGPTSLAQIALLPLQAGCDGTDVRNFTGAESIDVGGTGPALLGRTNRKGGTGRNQRQAEADRGSDTTRGHQGCSGLCVHGIHGILSF